MERYQMKMYNEKEKAYRILWRCIFTAFEHILGSWLVFVGSKPLV
jgi:hypothetical protein